MFKSKMTLILSIILVVAVGGCMVSGCNRDSDRDRDTRDEEETSRIEETTPKDSETTKNGENEETQETLDSEVTTASETQEQTTEVAETESQVLFNMYSIPADWPRVVPIMSEFQVTAYEWTDYGMYAAGYGDVTMSRANNFYTNAQKIYVSSNIWEQDPSVASVTDGTDQVFNYVGERQTMSVALVEDAENRVTFEIFYIPAP
ncbi:MAG: hypothetical protein GXY06_06150 [Clostridiaceae bacterium]|nr:hypothetical protein [Clostridiaceae bacterium]